MISVSLAASLLSWDAGFAFQFVWENHRGERDTGSIKLCSQTKHGDCLDIDRYICVAGLSLSLSVCVYCNLL